MQQRQLLRQIEIEMEPHRKEPFSDEVSQVVGDALVWSIECCRDPEEVVQFFQIEMNRRQFDRMAEPDKQRVRAQWKGRLVALKQEGEKKVADFDRTNTFTINKNDRRRNDRDAEYTGSLNIDGKEYWLNAWVKDGKRGKFFSGSVKPKDGGGSSTSSSFELSDDVPF
jgi:hypothetical protein